MGDVLDQAELARRSQSANLLFSGGGWAVSRPSTADLSEAWGLLLNGVGEGLIAARFHTPVTVLRRHMVGGSSDLARTYAELQLDAARLHAAMHTAMMQTVAEEAQEILAAHQPVQAVGAAGG